MTFGETLRQLINEGLSTSEIQEIINTTSSKSRPLHVQVKRVKRESENLHSGYGSSVEDVVTLTKKNAGYRITRGFNILRSQDFD